MFDNEYWTVPVPRNQVSVGGTTFDLDHLAKVIAAKQAAKLRGVPLEDHQPAVVA